MDADEVEKVVSKAEEAVEAFMDNQSLETAERADYWLSKMKLALGDRFSELHWHASAERRVVAFIEGEAKKCEAEK